MKRIAVGVGVMIGILVLSIAGSTQAQISELGEPPGAENPSALHMDQNSQTASHIGPTLPYDATWAGAMVIVILGMFVAAALVGPVARANVPDEPPPAHSHDEPPGSSHHHGPGGLQNPEPGHGRAHPDDAHH